MHQSLKVGDGVWLTRRSEGIELYFPPFRAPGAVLALALFGVACFVPGLFAAIAVAPLAISGPAGALAIWLMSIFILPFIVFGVAFAALAAYQAANSLTVTITPAGVRSLRRVLGFPLRDRRVAQADIAALDVTPAVRYRWPRDDTPIFDLVVRTKNGARVTAAEKLRGEELTERLRMEILSAGRIEG